ncbi:furin repeat-containing protein, putative [Entamoeba invadens IP1]|uniref:Furin repeat-containing protein, putative n=1 Tax=Entamoeba invadens IP1 TaxID=370355 RepID=A0A0A1U314_ENTIV|nr:furin repeat-containing protein, putative [Entamoeba invadens IP1]ELP87095.1 furin repeat-containing protein, putative [Entamoeba invadens IP1]|eukprot:XP_004253866.1 furin repeat-containing protein, putative [Entamoeba invadens IP1]
MLFFFALCLCALSTPVLILNGKEPRTDNPNCKSFSFVQGSNGATTSVTCKSCEDSTYKYASDACTYDATKCASSVGKVYNISGSCGVCDTACTSTCTSDAVCTCKFSSTKSTCQSCVLTNFNSVSKCDLCKRGMVTDAAKTSCVAITGDNNPDTLNNQNNCALAGSEGDNQFCLKCNGKAQPTSGEGLTVCGQAIDTITGCIRQNQDKCVVCDKGYYLTDGACTKGDDNCDAPFLSGSTVTCTKCREGYYLKNNACSKCTPMDTSSSSILPADQRYDSVCSLFSKETCTQCNSRCKLSTDGQTCVSTFCREMGYDGTCKVCEKGYYLLGNQCVQAPPNYFVPGSNTECVAGYYLDNTNGVNSCKRCKPHFAQCLTLQTPVPGTSIYSNTKATKSEPCDDENCMSCADDGTTCYKCFDTTKTGVALVKVGGTCVFKASVMTLLSVPNTISTEFPITYPFCRYRGKQGYFEDLYPAYYVLLKDKDETYNNVYCNPLPRLDYMYQYKEDTSSAYACVGANRDPAKGCQCLDGYYQSASKTASGCEKADTCVESANGDQCTVCPIGSQVNGNGKCVCPDKTYLKNGECIPCPDKCATCQPNGSNDVTCLTCEPVALGGNGRDASNKCECKTGYAEDTTQITVCLEIPTDCTGVKGTNYVITGNTLTCLKCNSANRSPSTNCQECVEGYFSAIPSDTGDCTECNYGDACKTCNSTKCTACKDTNALQENMGSTTACQTCKDGYAYNSDTFACERCRSVCDGCSYNPTTQTMGCTLCTNGKNPPNCDCTGDYYQGEDLTKCESCDNSKNTFCTSACTLDINSAYPRCTECTDDAREPLTNCSTCKDSKQFINANNECQNCADGCNSCTSLTDCTLCDPATNKVGSLCDKCKSGYYNNSNTCTVCDNTCKTCTSETECTECVGEHRLPSPGHKCEACADGYYWDATISDCVECSENCLKCSDSTHCLKCTTDGFFSETPVDGKCRCISGYIFVLDKDEEEKGTCQSCKAEKNEFCNTCGDSGCTACNAEYLVPDGVKCKCKTGYYTTSWDACVPCERHMPGCLECDKKDGCTKCDNGWKLNTTTGRCDGAEMFLMLLAMIVLALF